MPTQRHFGAQIFSLDVTFLAAGFRQRNVRVHFHPKGDFNMLWKALPIMTAAVLLNSAQAGQKDFVFTAADPPTQSNLHPIDLPGATSTRALGISPEGEIVGGYSIGSASHSFLISKDTVTTLDPPYGISGTSLAEGINPQGDIVGLYSDHGTVVGGDPFRTRSYLRDSAGNFSQIDFPGAENTFAIKISPRGQVVGCYHHQDKDWFVAGGGTMHGYVYQNGSYESLPVPGSMHNGITRDGRLIVGVVWPTSDEFHAYKVEDGFYQLLNLPSYVVSSDARDVNPSGEIVGYFVDSSNRTHGFLFNEKDFSVIDFPGDDVIFTRASGINPKGDIVGQYATRDSSGVLHTHGFVATRHR
jgi:uncharacterized membrane protein